MSKYFTTMWSAILTGISLCPFWGVALGQSESTASAQVAGPLYTMQITTAHNHVKAGSPVIITVVITNISGTDLWVGAGPMNSPSSPFALDVLDTSGKPALRKKVLRKEEPTVPGALALPNDDERPVGSTRYDVFKSGDSKTYTFALSDIYSLEEPGIYSIRGRSVMRGGRDWIRSNIVTITIE